MTRVGAFFLIVIATLLFPVFFQGKVLFPADHLHTMMLPFSEDQPQGVAHNHFVIDEILQYYPYKLLTQAALSQGKLASWNPYIMGGIPHYANTMATHFDITNIALLMTAMPAAFHLQVAMQLLISAVGMFRLLRQCGIGPPVASLFSCAYMLNSMFISTLFHQWIIGSFCWAPFLLAELEIYYRWGRPSNLIAAGLCAGLAFLGGTLQTAFYVFALSAIFSLAYPGVTPRRRVRAFLLPMGIGLLASSLMWLPTLEMTLIDLADGGSRVYGGHKVYPIGDRLLSFLLLPGAFLAPELLGSTRSFDLTKIVHSSMDDFTGFIGFAPAILGFWGCIALRRKELRMRPYVAIAVGGVLLPLITPLYQFLYHRFFILYVLGICVVGALALERFLSDRSILRPFWLRLFGSVWLLLLLSLLVLKITLAANFEYYHQLARQFVTANMYFGQAAPGNERWMLNRVEALFSHFDLLSPNMAILLCSTAATLSMLYLYRRGTISRAPTLCCGLTVVTIAQLIVFARSWLPMIDPGTYPLYPETGGLAFLRRDSTYYRVLSYQKPYPPLFPRPSFWAASTPPATSVVAPMQEEPRSQKFLWPNILIPYGISTLQGYESIKPRSMKVFSGFTNANLLGIANVKYVLTESGYDWHHPSYTRVYEGEMNIYQNEQWRPRAYISYSCEVIPDDATALARLRALSSNDPPVIFPRPPPTQLTESGPAMAGRVEILHYGPNRLQLAVESSQEAYLVLSDSYYPGWRAYIDGNEVEILRANVAMRAVCIPAGSHRVEFSFEPASFTAGLYLSAVVLLGSALGMWYCRRKSTKHLAPIPPRAVDP